MSNGIVLSNKIVQQNCKLSNIFASSSYAFLVIRNEALRVAFIHVEESGTTDGKISREFYSKLVKADINGKDQVKKAFP